MSMNVKLTMEAVSKSVPTLMDRSSAHVIRVIACHLMVPTAVVNNFYCMIKSCTVHYNS